MLPNIRAVGERIRLSLEGQILNNIDKIAADHIKKLIVVSPRLASHFKELLMDLN